MIDITVTLYYILNFYGLWIIYMYSLPRMLHIMQLEGYKNKEYIKWLFNNWKIAIKDGMIQLGACIITYLLITLTNVILNSTSFNFDITTVLIEQSILLAVFYITNIIVIDKRKQDMKNSKKPLVYTARIKRLMFANFIVMIMLEAMFSYYINPILTYVFIIFTIPINMVIANWFVSPTEEFINKCYIRSAKRKIKKNKKLIRIGITGSYGKTSTKFILETILKEKYNVLATPESYNTTMGNVRTIREKLKEEHEVYISEMGARNRYDIREICDFVKPQIGIITSIGPQHLETFKNIDTVIKTKYELIEGLTQDGVCFLPRDDENCYNMYIKENKEKYSYSMQDKKADVYAKDIEVNAEGSSFTVISKIGKSDEFKCTTRLLGQHNVQNILGCISIALHLGLAKDQIVKGVSNIEPIPHRLQILPTTNGTTVIDDAFNSNPVGSKMALDILKMFEGRKIIITPGMVELGKEEYSLNKEFGKYMAKSVDIAILVGEKRTKPIVEGLKSQKFDDMNIFVVPDLNHATKKLTEITKLGDVILFENDLPDNYNE